MILFDKTRASYWYSVKLHESEKNNDRDSVPKTAMSEKWHSLFLPGRRRGVITGLQVFQFDSNFLLLCVLCNGCD